MTYGLLLLALGFGLQFYSVWKKRNHSLNSWALRLWALGLLILVLESFKGLGSFSSWAGLVSLVFVLLILWKIRK